MKVRGRRGWGCLRGRGSGRRQGQHRSYLNTTKMTLTEEAVEEHNVARQASGCSIGGPAGFRVRPQGSARLTNRGQRVQVPGTTRFGFGWVTPRASSLSAHHLSKKNLQNSAQQTWNRQPVASPLRWTRS